MHARSTFRSGPLLAVLGVGLLIIGTVLHPMQAALPWPRPPLRNTPRIGMIASTDVVEIRCGREVVIGQVR
jgi:hypothetical protein